jgi:hypothetical protein
MVVPVLERLSRRGNLTVYSQDDPGFPEPITDVRDDSSLETSWRLSVETVPTLIKYTSGQEVGRTHGWVREEWQALCGANDLGAALPDFRPGCGSRTQDPGMPERLALRFGALQLESRAIEIDPDADPVEIAFERGWTDGLPVVPPTDLRIARMLAGTSRRPNELVGRIPPNLMECTVEKVAINAVMAGCKPEYFPVVLAAVEGALRPEFSMHGLLATLWFSGPVIIANGPITKRIGMNSGGNALGQGNRANATIGRALQLLIRNVGGGVPGEIDRSVLGNPGKYTFCFAEDESDPHWQPLHEARGASPGSSAVTLFHGDGVQGVQAWGSRTAEELSRSLAMALWSVCHPKIAQWSGAILVLSPDHYDIFRNAGWRRTEVESALHDALKRPGRDLVAGAQGVPEGIDPALADTVVDKFVDGYLLVVRAGGRGGASSAIIGGWTAQRRAEQVQIVTEEVRA